MQGVFTVMRNQTWFSDAGPIEQSNGFNADYTGINSSSPCSISSLKPSSIDAVSPLQLGRFNESIDISEITSPVVGAGSGYYDFQKGNAMHEPAHGDKNEQLESMGESGMGETSHHTDTSMEVDADDKNQFQDLLHGALISVDSVDKSNEKKGDQKSLRRLAQNREAARKSRLRKKAYVQQLESSRLKLNQLEQELQQARQQGMFISSGCLGDQSRSTVGNGAMAFDVEYARWLEEHQRQINDLRSAVNSNVTDNDLRLLVDGVMSHYDEVFRLKSMGAKYDVFHMLSGMWTTPAERCFMWLGGFRSSELLRILGDSLEPLTDQQLMNICNLQQSSQQAEDALSQGMEALQQSLAESLSGSIGPSGSANVADYMSQMAVAMGKLGTLENFLHQADLLRQQTLRQMYRILTTRQAARALLVISDYFSRLRALSSLWLARTRN